MTPQAAYDLLAPKLSTAERSALDVIFAAVVEIQPIDSAPTDGTVVMVNDTTSCSALPWAPAKYTSAGEWSGWLYDDDIMNDCNPTGPQPTHWLTRMPNAASAQGHAR